MADIPQDGRAESVSEDLPCVRCGYNLRTLAWTGRCPECGVDIIESSLPQRGFLFSSRQEANSVRAGLAILVVSTLIPTLAIIMIRLAAMNYHQFPSQLWWRVLFRMYYYATDSMLYPLEVVAIGFIAFSGSSRRTARRPRVAAVAFSTALAAFLSGLAFFWIWPAQHGFGHMQPYPPGFARVVVSLLGLCRPLSLVLLWLYLVRCMPEPTSLGTKILRVLALLGVISLGYQHIVLWVWDRWLLWMDHGWKASSFWDQLGATVPQVCLSLPGWRDEDFTTACWLVALLPLWLFVRKLNSRPRVGGSV